jgi:guanylate kinase
MNFILIGTSGAGKNTIISHLLEKESRLSRPVSCTTRAPRAGERDAKDYYFMSRAEFEHMILDDAFVEWAEVHGELYGTSKAELSRWSGSAQDLLFDVDCQGARRIKELYPAETVCIFILAPSAEEMMRRMTRVGMSHEELERRKATARTELQSALEFDCTVVNDKLDQAVLDVVEVIRRARLKEVMGEFYHPELVAELHGSLLQTA